ncbi:MAG TPA: hypothetical protein VH042_04470 [Solirubrobacterales bacterium]|jgi:hypothetical protein|nr:hypothetical protein [Solirubrobacterales bacterium]
MSPLSTARVKRDPIAYLALLIAMIALVSSRGGDAPAKPDARAHSGGKGAGPKLAKLKVQCPISNAVNFGTWCLESTPHAIPPRDVGKNNYFYAAQTCAKEGGWLPSAAQLIGAAPKAPLQSTIDDNPGTSGAEESPNPNRGILDKREMSGDLFTTTAGPEAAGSEGVTAGSRGNTSTGEPDPTPAPANPEPETLDYVTVYDNQNHGGFAGGAPVSKPENFRCAYATGSQRHPRASKTG